MSKLTKVTGVNNGSEGTQIAVVFTDENLSVAGQATEIVGRLSGGLKAFADAGKYTGKKFAKLDLVAPAGTDLQRLIVIGTGEGAALTEVEWTKLGGVVQAALGEAKAETATVYADVAGIEVGQAELTSLALGLKLRSYVFDKYKTKKPEDVLPDLSVALAASDEAALAAALAEADGLAEAICLARDLVNEPANVLGPSEFAATASELSALGVEVEVLGLEEMTKLKMGSLLGVAQGSVREPKLVIMRWNGGEKDAAPLAFIGKGVVFDSGGISLKPGAGMGDMKGDMGGAAAVTGLMHAVAARKAKANVVGVIGLVENMPDANAQRPGDIVTAMSGTTIEVLNTDAEGRLVLADALWYTQDRFKPAFMIDLATLTGAIMVALGNLYAGLFSNDDKLAENLVAAGAATDELLWRMPLAPGYDKIIDTPNADVKNTGGRLAGSITAAQFLQRFTNEVSWAHLDIAGPAFGIEKNEIHQGWATGYGVRLLDRLVRDFYEQ